MNPTPRLGLIAGAVFFAIDQVVKWIVTGPLGLVEQSDTRELLPIFNLTLVHNRGVSLGFLHADSEAARWGLVALTIAIAIGVVVWMVRERNRTDQFALGLVLGGALGNILDRVRLGHVTDYADLHFGDWRPFLIFNLGDAFITVGVLVLLVRALLVRDKPRAERASVENIDA
ncbi:MAG: signal peptidase II [Pseudomonadota bacterium]|nr:signal peptidase II [Pseudomonadota bacterium]